MQKRQQGIKHTLINKVIRASPELKRSDSPRLFKYIEDARNEDIAKEFKNAGHHILRHALPAHAVRQAKKKFDKELNVDTRRIPRDAASSSAATGYIAGAAAGTVWPQAFKTEPDSPSNPANPEKTEKLVLESQERRKWWTKFAPHQQKWILEKKTNKKIEDKFKSDRKAAAAAASQIRA